MAKADGLPTIRPERDSTSIPTRMTRTRHQRNNSAPRSIELTAAIEIERSRLMKAQAILNCARTAMECESESDTNTTYYPDVLQVVQELMSQSIEKLDSLRLRPMIEALERMTPIPSKEGTTELDARNNKELRDSANVIYIATASMTDC